MVSDPDPLALPERFQTQDGWDLVGESTETLSQLPTARIRGTTRQYDDVRTRDALRDATDGDVDQTVRFFATTRLGFSPPLPPGTGPSMIMPVLLPEARRNFKERLQDRGLVDVDRAGTERIRLGDRTRVRLTRYDARYPDVGGRELPLECWIGVWTDDTIVMATSGYPTVSLADQFDLDTDNASLGKDGQQFREQFRELLRSLG